MNDSLDQLIKDLTFDDLYSQEVISRLQNIRDCIYDSVLNYQTTYEQKFMDEAVNSIEVLIVGKDV